MERWRGKGGIYFPLARIAAGAYECNLDRFMGEILILSTGMDRS